MSNPCDFGWCGSSDCSDCLPIGDASDVPSTSLGEQAAIKRGSDQYYKEKSPSFINAYLKSRRPHKAKD